MTAVGWSRDCARGASFADEDYYDADDIRDCQGRDCLHDSRTHALDSRGLCAECQAEDAAAMGVAS